MECLSPHLKMSVWFERNRYVMRILKQQKPFLGFSSLLILMPCNAFVLHFQVHGKCWSYVACFSIYLIENDQTTITKNLIKSIDKH